MFFWACSLQNEVGDPPFFFTFLTSLTHHLSMLKSSEKKSMLENFRANVLKAYSGERQKLSTEQQFPLILTTSVFMISTPFSTAFTFLLMLMAIKIIAKMPDPDAIRTRSLLIWSQTRYHCATESIYAPRLNCRAVQSDFCQGWDFGSNCSI